MSQDKFDKLIEAIEDLSGSMSDLGTEIAIDFSVESYNLIASIYEEQHRIANTLERIATALEKQ